MCPSGEDLRPGPVSWRETLARGVRVVSVEVAAFGGQAYDGQIQQFAGNSVDQEKLHPVGDPQSRISAAPRKTAGEELALDVTDANVDGVVGVPGDRGPAESRPIANANRIGLSSERDTGTPIRRPRRSLCRRGVRTG